MKSETMFQVEMAPKMNRGAEGSGVIKNAGFEQRPGIFKTLSEASLVCSGERTKTRATGTGRLFRVVKIVRRVVFAALIALSSQWSVFSVQAGESAISNRQSAIPSIRVYFSPTGGVTTAICQEIGKATNSIYIGMYEFTSKPIAGALQAACRKGVGVHVILDAGAAKQDKALADSLSLAGAEVLTDSMHRIFHNKFCVVDGSVVITGSFNWTNSAESKNAENVVVISSDPELAADYLANWKFHANHSVQWSAVSVQEKGK